MQKGIIVTVLLLLISSYVQSIPYWIKRYDVDPWRNAWMNNNMDIRSSNTPYEIVREVPGFGYGFNNEFRKDNAGRNGGAGGQGPKRCPNGKAPNKNIDPTVVGTLLGGGCRVN